MRRLLALVFAVTLWFSFITPASAAVAGLTPCKDTPAFQKRAEAARNTTGDPNSANRRIERYADFLCGPEDGLPRIIADGSLSHADEFIIPGLIFLYIAGWIGWVGRAYLIAIRDEKNPEEKEIILDLPLAISKMLFGFTWPLQAIQEFLSGELTANDEEIPISPR